LLKSLASLVEAVSGAQVRGDLSRAVRGLAHDSRRVEPGFLFAALPGQKTDGHLFIPQALERGACAVLAEAGRDELQTGDATLILVPRTRPALAAMAASFYEYPSRRLALTGVTGTNGKTTTTYLLEAILRAAGRKTGVIGTLAYRIADHVMDAPFTTPEAPDLQGLLRQMADAGASDVAMEVSSHALAQHRADHCEFLCAIFTNLTRDHLDFHADAKEYYKAKARLFHDRVFMPAQRARANIINADDPSAPGLIAAASGVTITYGCQSPADVFARSVQVSDRGTSFLVETPHGSRPVALHLLGRFNVYNAMAALAAGLALGADLDTAVQALERVPPVRGRFEKVEQGQDFSVLIDYSHTPDSLEKALLDARNLGQRRVLVVFGCGGDRDPGKRPIMARLAARLADVCFITSDNPRSEDPAAIIQQVMSGVPRSLKHKCHVEPDRKQAIALALREARPGDLVLVAGKGHETKQIFADRVQPFDDREVTTALLREMLAEHQAARIDQSRGEDR
jgi:UDP-N-acetylmuramoyl-L-alanyl-D-glutamate--2,6-diaminopimelate ligase